MVLQVGNLRNVLVQNKQKILITLKLTSNYIKLKLTLKVIAFKENSIKQQCLRFHDDCSLKYASYSTSESKKLSLKISLLNFKRMLEKRFRPA